MPRFRERLRAWRKERRPVAQVPQPPSPLNDSDNISRSSSHDGAQANVQDYNSVLWKGALQTVKASYKSKEWKKIVGRLPNQDDRDIFEGALKSLKDTVQARDDAQWAVGGFKVRGAVDKIIGYANQFKDAGAAIAQADPTQHAGLAWGLLGIFVSAAVRNNETHEVIKNHETIARVMSRASAFAQVYLNCDSVSPDSCTVLRKDLEDLYEKVLRWLISAVRFVHQGQTVHYLRAFANDVSIQTDVASIKKLEDEVFKSQRVVEVQLSYNASGNIEKLINIVIELKTRVTSDERLRILEWVSDDLYLDHQKRIFEAATPGTGKWFLEHQHVDSWRKSDSSQLLWLKGKRGSGMTTVASIFVDSLMTQATAGTLSDRYVFYYCQKPGNQPTRAPWSLTVREEMYFSILRQLLSSKHTGVPLELAKEYEKNRGIGTFNVYTFKRMFRSLVEGHTAKTIMVVDGVDKLSKDIRTKIVSELMDMTRDLDPKLKILLVSSRETDVEEAVKNFGPSASILEMNNNDDIEAYIDHQVNEEFRLGNLGRGILPIKQNIIDNLKERHGGRFLYVMFSLQSLRRRGTLESILLRLRRMPEGLNELYEETYSAMRAELDPPDFDIVRLTFAFTLYGNPWVGMSAEEVLEAVWKRKPSPEDRAMIFDLCSGFLEEDLIDKRLDPTNDRCRFSHLYVKEFLRSHADYQEHATQLEIGDICLARSLSFFSPASAETWKKGDFICYAVTQWIQHYFEPVFKMFGADSIREIESRISKRLDRQLQIDTANPSGLVRCVEFVLAIFKRFKPESSIIELKMLFEEVTKMTSSPSNALFAAAMWRDAVILDRLAEDSDSLWSQRNIMGRTPLEFAESSRYHVDVCERLDLKRMRRAADPPLA